MKRKKSLLGIVALVLVVAFALVACSSPSTPESSSGASESASESNSAPAEESAAESSSAGAEESASAEGAGGGAAGSLQEVLNLSDEQIALLNGQEFNLGMLLAMTGNGDYYGRVMSAGAKLAVEQINEMTGMNINLYIEDHQSGDITAGTNGVRSLINKDGVSALLSSYGNITSAIVPQIQQAEVLTFNPGGANDEQLGNDFLWMGRMLFGSDPMPGCVDYMAANFPDAKKAALVMNAEQTTTVYEELLPAIWPEKTGGEIVMLETLNVGVTDFNQVITKIKSSGADCVLTTVSNNDLGYFLKQMTEANLNIPVMGVEVTDQQIELAGEAGLANYMFGQDYFDVNSENPFAKYFVETYREANGSDPDFYAANYYQNVFVLMYCMLDVLEGGGDIASGAALQESLIKLNSFPTVYGGETGEMANMSYTIEDHSCNLPMGIYKIENGKAVFLQSIEKIKVTQ